MIAAIAWKEYREHRSFFVVLVLLTGAGLLVMMQVFAPGSPWAMHTADPHLLTVIGSFVLTGMYALVCGGMMLAGERESKAIPFLDNLPASRAELWWCKMVVGAAFVLAHAVATVGIVVAVGLHKESRFLHPIWIAFLPLVALECYCWGLCTSAVCRTVLAAIAMAALLPLVVVWTFCTGIFMVAPPLLLAVRLGLMAVALMVSLGLFTSRDWEKRFGLSLAPPRGEVAPKRAPLAWEALLWVTFSQGKVELAVCLGVAVVGGFLVPSAVLPLWMLATLIIGCTAGAAVFSGEQAERSNRLFGDQRLPIGYVWAWKTGLWLVVLAFSTFVLVGVAGLRTSATPPGSPITTQSGADIGTLFDLFLGEERGVGWGLRSVALALVAPVTGFAFGQFSALVWRKGAVAVVFAVMAAAGAVSLWAPSLVGGGLAPWQLWVLPLVTLTACRLAQWTWAAEMLYARRPMIELCSGLALGVLFAAGAFVYRASEPPDGGDPFDLTAFRQSLAANDAPVGPLLRDALKDLAEAQALQERGDEQHQKQILGTLEHGWDPQATALGRRLDATFVDRRWPEMVREATGHPPVRLFDPRVSVRLLPPELTQYQGMAHLLAVRALQLQARGEHEPALSSLRTALALTRHLQHLAPPTVFRSALETEAQVLDAVRHWLDHVGRRPELVRKALDALGRHEDQQPPVSDTLKIQFSTFRHGLDEEGALPDAGADVGFGRRLDNETLGLVTVTPWERTRARRLVNALYGGRLRAADSGYVPAATGKPPADITEAFLGDWLGAPTIPSDTKDRLTRLLATSWLRGFLPRTEALQRSALMRLTRVRAARLQAALLLYHLEHGRPAAKLDDLAPKLLAEVPLDPLGNRPFGYRVSDGEALFWPRDDDDGRVARDVAKGRGVLWSVGPDGQDHGGTRQMRNEEKADAESDWIFLAPAIRE